LGRRSTGYFFKHDDVILDIFNTETEKWSYDEIFDIIQALEKTANFYVEAECTRGRIEIFN